MCCFVSVAILNAMGQTKFSAVISPAQIAKDEYATLRLIIENAADIRKITPPSLKDFVVVSGPNQESGMNDINGVVNQYVAISYILQPRRTGNILLPAATAIIDGKNYSSPPLKLSVKKGAGSNAASNAYAAIDPYAIQRPQEDFADFILKSGERVPDKVSKNMQLKLQTSKTSCFVGEPIVASYKLYSRLKSESRLAKNPSFNGFSVIELQQPDETAYAREKLNGREYNVYTIRKAQLYPLQDGTIEIESATLDNNIQFLKDDAANLQGNASGYINGFGLGTDAVVTESVSLTSKPVSIVVKPLPVQGKPASFNGAVGKFDITATLEKSNFST
ncbi:MAG TPA: BatD family protein, partial [Ferruginibacter sp.]|nr:BatD family protein [Ferruginibacter sp.]